MATIPPKGCRSSSNGSGRNARWVSIGGMDILFSYETPVAFDRGDVQVRREHISATTSQHLSSVGAGNWTIKVVDEFNRDLERHLFAEINGWPEQCNFLGLQGVASRVTFDVVGWLQLISSVAWRRPTKLQEAVGLLAEEVFRQIITARRGPSEFDGEIRNKLTALIAEEKRHREQIAAQAKPAASRGTTGDEDGAA